MQILNLKMVHCLFVTQCKSLTISLFVLNIFSAASQTWHCRYEQNIYDFQQAPIEKIKSVKTYLVTDSAEYLLEEKLYNRQGFLVSRDSFGLAKLSRAFWIPFFKERMVYNIELDSIIHIRTNFFVERHFGRISQYIKVTAKLNSINQITRKYTHINQVDDDIEDEDYVSSFYYNSKGHRSMIIASSVERDREYDTMRYFNVYDSSGFDLYQYSMKRNRGTGYNYNSEGCLDSITKLKVYHISKDQKTSQLDSNIQVTSFKYVDGRVVEEVISFRDQQKASSSFRWYEKRVAYTYSENEIHVKTTQFVTKDGQPSEELVQEKKTTLDESGLPIEISIKNWNDPVIRMRIEYKKYWF